jgi:hypothetical protein
MIATHQVVYILNAAHRETAEFDLVSILEPSQDYGFDLFVGLLSPLSYKLHGLISFPIVSARLDLQRDTTSDELIIVAESRCGIC